MPEPRVLRGPVWIWALCGTLLMQAVASFVTQSLPVIAPLITASAGMSPESIGNFSALVAGGTLLFLLLGGPFLLRWGPVRTLQLGAALSALGLLAAAAGTPAALVVASLLLGIGYGPSPPAGSQILAATAPPRHRSLIFSVKQAGAPLGGACAGLVTAPIAAAFGWSLALLVAVGTACIAIVAIQPLQQALDSERDRGRPLNLRGLLRPSVLFAPIGALRLHPVLPLLTVLGVSFAALQGCLFAFTVTWLTQIHGLSLVQAGAAFASMQAAGVVARVLLGWLADRTGTPIRNLLVQAVVASACALAFGAMPRGFPLPGIHLLAAVCGFLAASWNGIYLAEVARLVPARDVSNATVGSTLFIFFGYLAAPAGFALIVSASGSWSLPLALFAGQLAVVAGVVFLALRRIEGRAVG
ncbi:MFS transporter [Humitalea rosea]|uniref:MFS transporter n=1 Tax=Humitalea rosea TaxID=990373 RepID=UPI0013140E6D|nr:MFS transporter [Humitalea rosea]